VVGMVGKSVGVLRGETSPKVSDIGGGGQNASSGFAHLVGLRVAAGERGDARGGGVKNGSAT
jgi:hypothetical protein